MNPSIVYSNQTTVSLDVVSFYLFVIEGGILFILNSYLALVIFLTTNLQNQKEYLIIASNMSLDAALGLAYFLAGSNDLRIYYNEEYLPLVSKWQCFSNVHVIIFTIAIPGVGMNSFLTCVNSLFSVLFPIKYIKLDVKFTYCIPATVILCTMPTLILSGITSYQVNGVYDQPALCTLQTAGSTQVYQSLRGIRIASSAASVPIYLPIAYKIYKIIASSSKYTGMTSKQKEKLIKMSLTVILISLNELALFGAPDLYLLLHPTNPSFVFYIMNLNKGMINIIIFMITQKELRKVIFQTTFGHCIKKVANFQAVSFVANGTQSRQNAVVNIANNRN